jgi:hypothetical protein
MHNPYAKRGNFILKGKFRNFYKCHNCGEFKKIDRFFKDFGKELELRIINYISETINDFKTFTSNKYDPGLVIDTGDMEDLAIDRDELKKGFGLLEVKGTFAGKWLRERLQFVDERFLYSPKKNYVAVLNLTRNGKIMGLQRRNFGKRDNPKYQTYTLSKLYSLMKKDVKVVSEEADTFSQVYNIFFVDMMKPITLFEGPMDCFLFRNSVANAGANRSFPIDIPHRYFFDDDETGRKKTLEKLNEGYGVFLWGRLKRTMNLPYRTKWDLNDLHIYVKKMGLKMPVLETFFSDDPLDMIDI